jgi:predicted dehydrogenase
MDERRRALLEKVTSREWDVEKARQAKVERYQAWLEAEKRPPLKIAGPDRGASRLNVGVVGLGRGRHMANFCNSLPQSRTIAVCDVVEGMAEFVAEKQKIPRWYQDYEEMLKDDEVRVIVVETGTDRHGEHTIQALEAGKHVFVEMPAAVTLEECRRIVDLSESKGLKVQMGNQLRWYNRYEALKQLCLDGEFGKIQYMETEYNCDYRWRKRFWVDREAEVGQAADRGCRGGIEPPLNAAVHTTFDTARWLLGGEQVVEVEAFGMRGTSFEKGRPQDGFGGKTTEGPDSVVALMRTQSGVIIKALQCYGFRRPHLNYLALYGTKGCYEGERRNEVGSGYVHLPYRFLNTIESGPGWMELPLTLGTGPGHQGAEIFMMTDLFDAIIQGRRPMIDAVEGARSCAAAICGELAAIRGERMSVPQF